MKTSINLFSVIVLCILLFAKNLYSQNEITSPGANLAVRTQYADPNPPNTPWPANQQDSVFIFCSDNPNAGSLTAPGAGYCTYQWSLYNPASGNYGNLSISTQTANNLQSGGYRVIVTCGATVNCYFAWVYVNQTFADMANIAPGCAPFVLTGTARSVETFTVYNPPLTSITIDTGTIITVCFSAQHTYVSDLGFYLIAPGYGQGCMNATTPCTGSTPNNGIVQLLPSVAAWDDVTCFPSTIYGCTDPSDIGTNCNSGDDVENFCFTTEQPAGDPNYVPCMCDLPVPLTGTFASFGPWSPIYGAQVPAPMGTPANCGWSLQIYDCIGQDVGYLTNATITFEGDGVCGHSVFNYNTGTIASTINDNSCTSGTASIYSIPVTQPYSYTLQNTINYQWTCSPGPWQWGNPNVLTVNINPPPQVSTWFYFTVTDNFGCVVRDSSQFIAHPADATITHSGPFCINSGLQTLSAVDPGGTWGCIGCNPNPIVNPYSGTFNPSVGQGCYLISYSIGGICPGFDTTTICVQPEVSISNISTDCINFNSDYRFCFDIFGGGSHCVSINGGPCTNDSVSGNHFCYTAPSFTTLHFTVGQDAGCGTISDSVMVNCDCQTNAGTVSQTLMVAYSDESNTSAIIPGTNYNDGNDRLVYYLHCGSLNYLVQPLDSNSTGAFNFIPGVMSYNTTYYISPVAANDTFISPLNWINREDPCLSVGLGTPVMWLQNSTGDADFVTITHYSDTLPYQEWPPSQQDPVFIFCSDNPNAGSVTAPGTAGCTYQWALYDSVSNNYFNMGVTTKTANNLHSGGYRTIVTCGATVSCYYAWVYVNNTIANVDTIAAGCYPFIVHGSMSNPEPAFKVFNPPPSSIIIDGDTKITVCFTAQHTYVSDLGFYLIAPNYGPNCSSTTTPCTGSYSNYGIVQLLPSVAAWCDDVTCFPSTIFGCSTPSELCTNCNSGDDVENFCFTTEQPACNPNYIPCVCDMTTPLTGTFASFGPWSTIYGQQVPAPVGTAVNCGWSVQIYDCIQQDVGYLTNATITIEDDGACGHSIFQYNTGTIQDTINSLSCDAVSASNLTFPVQLPYNYSLTNTVTGTWSCSPGTWNPAWGSTNFATNPNPNIDPPPAVSTYFILTVTDNFGCTVIDSSIFQAIPVNATINDALIASPCGTTTMLYAGEPDSPYPCIWSCNIPGVIFGNPDSSVTSITIPGSLFGSESFADIEVNWEQSIYCGNYDTDSTVVRFYQKPTSYAGPDTVISLGLSCNLFAEWSLGDGVNDAIGIWSNCMSCGSPGAAVFANSTNPNTSVTVSQNGAYYFIWKERNIHKLTCFNQDTVMIEFEDTTLNISSVIPALSYLEVNPNPFNDITEISYFVKAECNVNLEIIDMQGRTIKHLVNEKQSAGEYKYFFSATVYGKGIYYLKFNCGSDCFLKKLVKL